MDDDTNSSGTGGSTRPDRTSGEKEFQTLFGIWPDDLIREGIDPKEYARRNLDYALKKSIKNGNYSPESSKYNSMWHRWGVRAYAAMFVAIGLLFVEKLLPSLEWVATILQILDFVVILVMAFQFYKYRKLEREARRRGA